MMKPMLLHYFVFVTTCFYMGFSIIVASVAEERYEKDDTQIFCGKVLAEPTEGRRLSCSVKCLAKLWCNGVLFNPSEFKTNRCKLIFLPVLTLST